MYTLPPAHAGRSQMVQQHARCRTAAAAATLPQHRQLPHKTSQVNTHVCSVAIVSIRRSVALLPLELAVPSVTGAAMDAPPSPSVAACPEGPGASGLTDAEAGS